MKANSFLKFISSLSNMIELTIETISQKFDFENPLPGRNINAILNNKDDARKIDHAVEFLIKNKNVKSKEVLLSDNETLTISIS